MAKKVVDTKEKKNKKPKTKYVISVLLLLILGGSGYLISQKPLVWNKIKQTIKLEKKDVYQQQIDLLNKQLQQANKQISDLRIKVENPDYSKIYNRIDNMEQINVNTIKSKANVETVLGLIGRMDVAEGRINDLGKVTNNSAMTLMATMLVKDAAERNDDFLYEAEVLAEVAKGNYKIQKEVEQIVKIAKSGLPEVKELQELYNIAYEKHFPKKHEEEIATANNWKERVYNKLNKVVQIKKKGEEKQNEKTILSDEDLVWEIVMEYMRQGDVVKALGIVKKPLNHKMAKDENLSQWLEKAQKYDDFYKAVSNISASSLAYMKVEYIRR